MILAVPTLATAAPKSPDDAFRKAPSKGALKAIVTPRARDASAKVNVMVELGGDPVAVAEAKANRTFTKAERGSAKQKLRTAQDAIAPAISADGGKVVAKLQSAYNGIQVRIAAGKADRLAKLPGVVAVHPMTARTIDNTVSVPFLGVPQVWQDTGYTGKGVKVAIVDTGIDYTHADFGGPGTTAAWDAAHAASAATPDPALFGVTAPRVKGGYDFVGDGYDATGENGSTTPTPDDNPLDCYGHGSHVAGTAGGSGVTADGKTYTGAYNADTEKTAFKVGPGVAPQVDLYALKVFGCEGATDFTVAAIDWAVDHGMDVINMSLGGDFGGADDPDAVAASNAVAAGVVVVASSGNAGHNPYITGSPASGHGVLSVAAVDSTASFPGADLTVAGKTVNAINANGAELPTSDFPVVVLKGDDALGCSVKAFTNAKIEPGLHQIAVVTRGDCGRVDKAVFGEQAGAAAVVMVNNAPGYPPYEGTIKETSTGDPFLVTIPFLGVTPEGGAVLAANEGKPLTMAVTTLPNPGYTDYASFTSAGPANPDSSLSPNISAPGVSIRSVAIGTGNDSVVESGTSMAAPHVAGVAALAVQAHPGWRAQDVAATLGSTADPDRLKAYEPVLGGGLVDAAQAVKTSTYVTGDTYRTDSGRVSTASLSFGFDEPSVASVGVRTITITNRGNKAVTYTLSSTASDASVSGAKVRFSDRRVRVRAHSSERVAVSLVLPASAIGSSIGGPDQFGFRQAAGNVVLTSSQGVLRVPYLLVPRAQANVVGDITGRHGWLNTTTTSGDPASNPATGSLDVRLANPAGALNADADFYTWGLSDAKDKASGAVGSGYDLRAAGVQSFDNGDDKLVVFAVNTHDRWTNAAMNEFDVLVDTTGDGTPDIDVFSYDSGALRGDPNGLTEVFVQDLKTGDYGASGYYAQAPTDSSTILLPVDASTLGLSAKAGAFSYTVESSSQVYPGESDAFDGSAAYNPWARAIADGDYVTVARNRTAKVTVAVSTADFTAQAPKGVMVVVYDNKSGAREALLLGVR